MSVLKTVTGGCTERLTTLSVPTRTFGWEVLLDTIWAMKFAVMPMIARRDTAWSMRTILKVAPRAPYIGPAMWSRGLIRWI